MSFSLTQLFSFALVYLAILFGSAYATEQGWLPRALTKHHLVRVTALGVFAGAISFYGSLGLAHDYGSSYLLYFFGASAAFLLSPLLLNRITRIGFAHKLSSVADVFAYRYPRSWVGGLVTILMLAGVLPLIALQIQAVAATANLMNAGLNQGISGLVFCTMICVFAILFGARHVSTRNKHEGLVTALALEALFKLLAFLAVAIYAVYFVFSGPEDINQWLQSEGQLSFQADSELPAGPSRSLLLIFFAAVVVMPHMFHILLAENDDPRVVTTARWGFPLYMMALSMCVPPILWASLKAGVPGPPEFFAITLGLHTAAPKISFLAFIGGFAACSGVVIVSTLALASMSLNHLLLPIYRPSTSTDFFGFLLAMRRVFIVAIVILAYVMYSFIDSEQSLLDLAIIAFVAALQFLPGLLGAFYWHRSNSLGLSAGLFAGFLCWAPMLLFPLVTDSLTPAWTQLSLFFAPEDKAWHITTVVSLLANSTALVTVSLLTRPNRDEMTAAAEFMSNSPIAPYQGELQVKSVSELAAQLRVAIGEQAAERELRLALSELPYDLDERRPFALTQLRNRIESNLTSIVGQTIARRIFNQFLPFRPESQDLPIVESFLSMENRFEDHHAALTGLAAELDNLRRYHRQILQDLPTAVCTLDVGTRVLTWNGAMETLTGVPAGRIVDHYLSSLPNRWGDLLLNFMQDGAASRDKIEISTGAGHLLLSLHKAHIDSGDIVIVVEDVTDAQIMERQLQHNQRLASIGQLAAGVAHEVGNPITGIACLAQNLQIETNDPELLLISNQILEQTQRVSSILESLVSFAHSGPNRTSRKDPVNLRQCINEAISLLSLAHDQREVKFLNQCPDSAFVLGEAQRLMQVFVNVLSNARDASPKRGRVTVQGRIVQDTVVLDIEDEGHGIRAIDPNQVFEPFYTTKDPGKGTGLGLAIVTTIVREHNGEIFASRRPTVGTSVTIRLPNYDRPSIQLTSAANSLLS